MLPWFKQEAYQGTELFHLSQMTSDQISARVITCVSHEAVEKWKYCHLKMNSGYTFAK